MKLIIKLVNEKELRVGVFEGIIDSDSDSDSDLIEYIVALLDAQPVGCAKIKYLGTVAELEVFVLPQYRKRGFGALMVGFAIKCARGKPVAWEIIGGGAASLVEVRRMQAKSSLHPKEFLEKLGFVESKGESMVIMF